MNMCPYDVTNNLFLVNGEITKDPVNKKERQKKGSIEYLWSCPMVSPAPCSTSLLKLAISSFND